MFLNENYNTVMGQQIFEDFVSKGKIKTRHNVIVVEPEDDETEKGFFIAGKHGTRDTETTFCIGTVIAVGDGKITKYGVNVPNDVKIGDKIMLSRAHLMREKVGDKHYYITKDEDVLGILNDE